MRWLLFLALLGAGPQEEKKAVACTLPVLEVLAREVGGDDFTYFSLSKPDQDPHHVRATPILQRKLREADLFVEIGLQLEPWADMAANKSGNTKIQKGRRGRIVASRGIRTMQVPSELDRSEGHIHPGGNPHLWLDPLRAKKLASNIADGLIQADPGKKDAVKKRLKDFKKRIDRAVFGEDLVDLVGSRKLERLIGDGELWDYLKKESFDDKKLEEYVDGWIKRAAPLRGQKAVEFHQDWIYTATLLGFELVGTIEEKPGIPPGPRHQVFITKKIRDDKVAFIIVDNFYDPSLPNRISKDTGCPTVLVENQPSGDSYFKWYETIIDQLVKAINK